jgi:hypothetical protein
MIEEATTSDIKLPPATSLTSACETAQDWLAVAKPPVRDGALDDCVAVFSAGDAGNGLLAVAPGEAMLLDLRPASGPGTTSDAGWRSASVQVPDTRRADDRWPRGDIRRLTAFAGPQPFALVQFEEKTGNPAKRTYIEPMALDPASGEWKSWRLPGDLPSHLLGANQTETYFDRNGEAMIYTKANRNANEDVFALVFRHQGQWATAQARFAPRPGKPATFRLLPNGKTLATLLRLGDGNAVEFMHIDIVTPPDEDPYIQHPAEWQRRQLNEFGGGQLDAARLIPVPDRAGSLILHAADGHVWLVTDFESASPRVTRLTGTKELPSGASQVRVSVDAAPPNAMSQHAVLFIVDATEERRVWVARETAPNSFSEWAPLGEQVRALATAPRMRHGTELFLVADGKSTTIERRNMDANGEAWHASVVESTRPPAESVETTTHTARLALRTEKGAAAPRAAVHLETSYPCVAIIDGRARHLAPGAPFRALADDGGELLVRVPTTGADAPQLVVRFANGNRVTVPMDESTTRRMAGNEQSHAMDEQRLDRVKLFPSNMAPSDRAELTTLVRNAGNQIGIRRQEGWREILAQSEPSWHGGMLDPTTGQWQIHSGTGELPADLAAFTSTADRVSIVSGELNNRWGLIGDFLNWVKRTAQKITKWVVEFGQTAAKFFMTIAGKVFELTIQFAEGIARGVETLFNGIAAAANHLVDTAKAILEAVRSVFDIDAIRRTNKGLELCLDSGLGLISQLLRSDGIRKPFDSIVDTVVKGLDAPLGAIEQYLSGIKLGGLSDKGIPDKPDEGSGVPGRMALLQKGGVQARWFSDRVAANPSAIATALAATTLEVDSGMKEKLQRLADLIRSEDPNRKTLVKLFLDRKDALMQMFSEGRIPGTALVELLGFLRDILKLGGEIVKSVVAIVFELLAQAVDLLRKLLSITIPIPGLDKIVRLILGRDMKVSDLLTLMLAVPTTILWKIISLGKDEPLPQAKLEALEKTLKEWGVAGSGEDGGGEDAEPLSGIADFFVNYIAWQAAKLLGKRDPIAEAAVRKEADKARRAVDAILPVTTVVAFATAIGSVLIQKPAAAAADTMDALGVYGSGSQTFGFVGKFFLLTSLVAASVSVWANSVQNATVELLPDTPEGRKWKEQRQFVEPLDWASLSWIVSVVLGVVGVVALKAIGTPIGDWVSLGLTVILGIFLLIGTTIYTGFFIQRNGDKIRGWKIAKEIGTLIGALPSLTGALPGVINLTMKVTHGLTALLLPPYLAVGTVCNLVSNVTAVGALIDETIATRWSTFKPVKPFAGVLAAAV